MKYYLIKANDMKKTEFVGEYYFDLQKEPVELSKIELEFIIEDHLVNYDPFKLKDKLRKVLDNGQ